MNESQMNTLKPESGWRASVERNRDLAVVIALAGILMAILVPLPGHWMDGLLGANIGFSVLVLLTVVYLKKPLEFASFPSLLLLATLYRLALNIATTRLVLSKAGEEGTKAAGDVVYFFGEFVSGSNAVVGFIIFSILVVIQFVVVTKGATRIAEVAARFSLDRMPGAQMSIDADLNSGSITSEEAQIARQDLAHHADFYGAMDGASKFVRGDAIAAVVITMINIVGGFTIGIFQYGMSFSEAGRVFTTLTVGDGLVTQVPALFISIAAGLMVTRASSRGKIGDAVVGQLFGNPKALVVTALILVALAFTGLPPVVLGLLAVALGAIAWTSSRAVETGNNPVETAIAARHQGDAANESRDRLPSPVQTTPLSQVISQKPIRIVLGYGLQSLMDPEGEGVSLGVRIQQLREELQKQLGFHLPPVHAAVQLRGISPDEFQVFLREVSCYRGSLRARQGLIVASHRRSIASIEGDAVDSSLFAAAAKWISLDEAGMRKGLGYTVHSAQDVLLIQLRRLILDNISELLTQRETRRILDGVPQECRSLVKDVVPGAMKLSEVQKILQGLLAEEVPIRDTELILEALIDGAQEQSGRHRSVEKAVERVRVALGRAICDPLLDATGKLHAVTLDPEVEALLLEHLDAEKSQPERLRLSPQDHVAVTRSLAAAVDELVADGFPPLIITASELRGTVKKLMEKEVPSVVVLSYNEVTHGLTVEARGMARIGS